MTDKRKQMLFDIFITAIEGGIGYWAYSEEYHWRKEDGSDDLDGFHSIVVDTEDEDAFERSTINAAVIEKGIQKIKDPKFQINDTTRKKVMVADILEDDYDFDADDADCIVQAGLFGELMFG